MAEASLPDMRARRRPGTAIAAMIPMMATTMSSSISVKPLVFRIFICLSPQKWLVTRSVSIEIEAGVGQPVGRLAGAPRAVASDRWRQALRQDHRRRFERHRALDRVLELANVARPVIAEHELQGILRDAGDVLPHLLAVLRQKVVGEQRNVFAALAQRL